MTWDVEYTDEFGDWWASLTEDEQVSLAASVQLLEARGPTLGHPHSSGIHGSKHGHMRELRTQHGGRRPLVSRECADCGPAIRPAPGTTST
jgi:hypothetical protein